MTTDDQPEAVRAEASPCGLQGMAVPAFCPGGPAPRLLPDPADCAFFLDLDGTLLDLAATPEAVRVSAGLGDMLARLERTASGALALVTGRTVDFVDRLFPGRCLTVAGLHGAALRPSPALAGLVPAPAAPRPGPAFRAAREDARRAAQTLPGVLFEDKARAFALHYRQAPARREAVARIMAQAQRLAGPGYLLRAGKCVLELCPSGADKGTALRTLMAARPFRGRYPVAAGDDLTDEAMFRAVNAMGGLSVRVGGGQAFDRSAAATRIATPEDLRTWLGGLAA